MTTQSSVVKVVSTLSLAVVGTLSAGLDKSPTIVAPCDLTIIKAKLVVKTAPTGADLIIDINKDGSTIFTTQSNRPKVMDGNTQGDSGTPDVTSLVEGDEITVDIDQIGSSGAGEDLTVEIICLQAVQI